MTNRVKRLLAETAPTEDVRERLARVISETESATDEEGAWALPEDVADAILAAGTWTLKEEQ